MIRGVTKKGKEFWKLDSNLTETIKGFGIEENRLWTAGVILDKSFTKVLRTIF